MAEQKSNGADIIKIKTVPKTKPDINEHFELIKNTKLEDPKDGEILVESEYVSVDPYLRGRMGQFYGSPSKQMQSFTVAKVIKSKNEKFPEGCYIYGHLVWSSKQIIDAKSTPMITTIPPIHHISDYKPKEDKTYYKEDFDDAKFDVARLKEIPHSYYVGSYGMPGATAFYGMIYRGGLKKGDKVLISGAAGAVGSICGQIAKIYGCYVVGIAGTDEKIKWITEELGFDAGINYKEYGDDYNKVQECLKAKFPDGIDLYFDNVGGVFTEAVWDILNVRSRVVVCGQIASYNADPENPKLIRPFLGKTIYKEIDIRGFHITPYLKSPKFYYEMGRWIVDKKIKVRETVIDGFEKLPEAFVGLFSGRNIGKMVVKCSE